MGSVRRSIVAGVLAAAAGLAAAEGVAAIANLRESPVVAVAQGVIRVTPGPIAEAVIGWVGTKDKPLTIACVVVAVLAIGALAGRWWDGRRAWSLGVVAALVVGAGLAVLSRPYGSVGGLLACAAAGLATIATLSTLQKATESEGRRSFLRTALLLGLGVALVGGGSQALASRHRRRRRIEQLREAIPSTAVTPPPGVDVSEKLSWVTPNRDFYRIDTALTAPLIDPSKWRLRIHGMVDRELEISYDDLVRRADTTAWVTLCCVSNPVGGDLVGNALWGGVLMRELLEEAGVQDDADALLSTSEDGWTCGTPLAALTDGRDAMLALTMNGEPLPVPHGFPVRQVVPGLYGYVSATKWVVDWEVTRFADVEAYWTQRGWSEQGPVKTASRIDVPELGDVIAPGRAVAAGVAWRQHVGIERVEVRVDDGPWQEATLGRVPSDDTWVQWRIEWDAVPGQRRLTVRAVDAEGTVQTAAKQAVLPDGATGHDSVSVLVR